MRIVVDNRRHPVVRSEPTVLGRSHRRDSGQAPASEEPMFKRRRPDDPQSDEAGAALPAGLTFPDEEAAPDKPGAPSGPTDSGLGVPPFRPAPPQEVPNIMSRPPFSTAPSPQAAPQPAVRPALSPVRPPVRDP